MKRAAVLLFVNAMLALASSSALAFDGQRQGFQLGIGIGAHTSELTYDNNFAPSSADTEKELAASLMLGYGFSNRIVGYIGGKGGAISVDSRDATLAVSGFGASIYWNQASPSLYLTGVVGKARMSIEDENDALSDEGDGWLVGIGYELSHRLHLEVSHARGELIDPLNSANKSTLESSFLTLQYIWY